MDIQIINPITYPRWDELVLSGEGYSFFHSSTWARVLTESYGYTPLYFTVLENGKIQALMPIMEVDSFLTGKRGISLPFTDFCEPIILNGVPFPELFKCVIEYGQKHGWKYVELRSGQKFLSSSLPSVSSNAPTSSFNLDPLSISLSPSSLSPQPATRNFLFTNYSIIPIFHYSIRCNLTFNLKPPNL